jgi:hypothetical protein
VKRLLAVILMIVAAHLLLFYLNFAFKYGDTIGVEQAARESKVAGNMALLFLATAVVLQFLTAGLLKSTRLAASSTNSSEAFAQLPESHKPALWERYGVLLAASAAGTSGIFWILFFIARRTGYLSVLLKFLRLG